MQAGLPLHVLVRARPGDFCFDAQEKQVSFMLVSLPLGASHRTLRAGDVARRPPLCGPWCVRHRLWRPHRGGSHRRVLHTTACQHLSGCGEPLLAARHLSCWQFSHSLRRVQGLSFTFHRAFDCCLEDPL